jgi:hypothetical protein
MEGMVKETRFRFIHIVLVVIIILSLEYASEFSQQAEVPFAKYKVIPNPATGTVTVEAQVELQNRTPYIKDFGELQSIRWLVGGKELAVLSQRIREIMIFNGLPFSGKAKAVYTIKTTTKIPPKTSIQVKIFISSAARTSSTFTMGFSSA